VSDKTFLMWIYDRLHYVHGESELYDYMHKLGAIIEAMDEDLCTSNTTLTGYRSPPLDVNNELNELIEKGTKAWADVPDATQWVDELRS
jgi:hypothetical protein